jgi:hypothetical protein
MRRAGRDFEPLRLPGAWIGATNAEPHEHQGQNSSFPRAALQPKSLAGQEKGEERIGNTVKPFDEPGGDFRYNQKGRGPFGRCRRCSSLMIV